MNDPEGGYAGLVDDHYFYLVRGWQILFGDLPDRDFVDPGAPLMFFLSAGVQRALGPGTWSEMAFCVTLLSIGTVLTYFVARRASGSTAIGLVAAIFQVALNPRFYNYPKVLVYAAAIPALWAFIDAPTRWRTFWLALITAIALMLRHDHGVFVGFAVAVTIAWLIRVPLRERFRHALIYGGLVLLLLSPYLLFLQTHGGIVTHVVTANSWGSHDRARAPLLLPTFSWDARPDEDPLPDGAEWWLRGIFERTQRNYEPWLFYLLVLLPVVTLATLRSSSGGTRALGEWPYAREKIAIVAILGLVLDAGFLRGNLTSRFGDVSVTSAILLAWLLATLPPKGGSHRWLERGSHRWPEGGGSMWLPALAGRSGSYVWLPALAGRCVLAVVVVVTTLVLLPYFRERLEATSMADRPLGFWDRFIGLTERMQTWPLETWTPVDTPGSMKLAFYLRDCTAPTDRVLVSQYLPQVLALAQRPFAGGHGDLRPGFFGTAEDQRLTIARLERQRVPVMVMPPADAWQKYTEEFPRLTAYLAMRYRVVGDFDLGDDLEVRLLADRSVSPTGTYAREPWPCFR